MQAWCLTVKNSSGLINIREKDPKFPVARPFIMQVAENTRTERVKNTLATGGYHQQRIFHLI